MFGLYNYTMHDVNTHRVFQYILTHGPLTKKSIQLYTNYSWGGVCNSISKLLQSNSILQYKQRIHNTPTPGRIPTYFDINYKENLCVGVDVTLGRVTGVISYLNGECIYSKTNLMHSNLSKDMIEGLINMLEDIFNYVENPQHIKAIGLALPGSTVENWVKQKLEHPFHGVFPKNLQEIIQERFGVMTEVFHDPDCVLVAEFNNMSNEDIKDNILVLRWSYGIGLSMMIRGSIYHGSNGMAGEIGHTVINSKGELCSCGKRGCLETYSSVLVLLNKLKKEIYSGKCKELKQESINTFSDLLRLYEQRYEFVEDIMYEALEKTSITLANTINIIDPSIVIVSGEFSHIPKERFESFKCMIKQNMMIGSEAEIRQSVLDDNAAALGAALLMKDKIYYEMFDLK